MSLASPNVTLEPGHRAAGDTADFWRVPRYSGLDCLRAAFRRHAYVRHTHETFAIACVSAGCETFFYRGAQRYATPGTVCVVHPDEPHDGEPHGGYFIYRTLYPSLDLIREIAEDARVGRPADGPWFPEVVMQDPLLAAEFRALHDVLGANAASALETDTRLVSFFARLVARHGGGALPPATRESRAVARARDMIDARFTEEIGLDTVAREVGLSRTHLIRAFKAEFGLSPHAWQIDRRVRAACRLLAAGEAPANVAGAVGLFDQSHLNRVFKARIGVTPGAFASKTAERRGRTQRV